jgi:hypothetical protein
LALALTLLIILIVSGTRDISTGMVIAMYTVVLALVAFLYAVMYRMQLRLNWEVNHRRSSGFAV